METVVCHPLTADRWSDLEALFGERGACGGCWCMWWRLPHRQYEVSKGEANRQALRELVERGPAPGVLAYRGSLPVGWCSIAPRSEFARLATSRLFKPLDDRPVWSVTCFFVAPGQRGAGVGVALLRAALDHAAAQGARTVEAYPVVPNKKTAAVFLSAGVLSHYLEAGFRSLQQPSPTRHLVRIELEPVRRVSSA